MKKKLTLNLLLLLLVAFLFFSLNLLAGSVHAYSNIENPERELDTRNAKIIWEDEVILVKGQASADENMTVGQRKLMSQRGARTTAYSNAIEFLEGVQVDSSTTVRDTLTTSANARSQAQGFVEGAIVVYEDFDRSHGISEVILEIPIDIDDPFFQDLKRDSERETTRKVDVDESVQRVEEEIEKEVEEEIETTDENYTGLIVDTRGLNIEPALYPQVFDYEGESIYDITQVDLNNSEQNSLVAYSRSLDSAKNFDRIGDNPLVVEAVSEVEGQNTDVILNQEDSRQSQNILENLYQNQGVIFIID